jgi:kinesin family protein 18/19
MIAHVSPSALHREETRNTLLYGQRARAISNRVKKFIYPGHNSETSYIIDELRNEVRRLQLKLEQRENTPIILDVNAMRNIYTATSPTVPLSVSTSSMSGPLYHEGYIDKHERHELTAVKQQLSSLFDEEFRLRNDLLKLDGAMLQSALDCEILRLMVLDWENLKSSNKDYEKDSKCNI